MNPSLLKYKNLEDVLSAYGGAVNLLRSSSLGPFAFPVAAEFTNWRDEQRAWKNNVALLDLSYHMSDLYVKGPDALALLQKVGLNKLGTFPINRGKQLIAAGHDGYMIGDGICFHTSDDVYRVVGPPMIGDWVEFNAITGKYNVDLERDTAVSVRGGLPKIYIYQIQGPHALTLMKEVTEGTLPDIKFFHIGEFKIKGKPVRALRHGMAGEPGFEIFGPWEDHLVIREALEKAGEAYGLRKIGGLAYPTTAIESAWMPLQCPAIYHSAEMKPYREWLTPKHLETQASMGGSFYSDNITDYYFDPIEVGYGSLIDFDHDFIGRDALKKKIQNPKRKKVTLLWNAEDVTKVMNESLFAKGTPSKFINLPLAVYATFQFDEVRNRGGKSAGLSQYVGYSANAGHFWSLAILNNEDAEIGNELVVRWGEPNSKRPTVEKNEVREVRVTVAQAPYFQKTIKKD